VAKQVITRLITTWGGIAPGAGAQVLIEMRTRF